MVEGMGQLFVSHATAGICHGQLDVIGLFGSRDGDAAALVGELASIVGQRIEHEERQYAVGLDNGIGRFDAERYALHIECRAAATHDVEQRLQWETLDVEIEFAATQLNPRRQQVVLFVNLIGDLADVVEAFVIFWIVWIF